MTSDISLQGLKINKRDPRQSPLFLDLSWSMQNANISRLSEDEWKTLDTQCRTYWHKYGYDLQSGCWFCLISLQLHGWNGLAPALNILLEVWHIRSSEYCWPPITDSERRRFLLEWFNTYVVTSIYRLDYASDFSAVSDDITENIAQLYKEAMKADARCKQSLKNLHFFLQVRSRAFASLALKTTIAETSKDRQQEPFAAQNKVDLSVWSGRIKRKQLFLTGVLGIMGGVVAAILILSGMRYMEKPALTQQLFGVLKNFPNDDEQVATAWQGMKKKELESHRDEILSQSAPLLNWIASRPSDDLLQRGALLALRLENTWPGNAVSRRWNHELQVKADSLPSARSYQEITADLNEFDAKLASAEQKKGRYLTVSELKSFSWRIRRELESGGIPPAELIRYSLKKEEPERSANLKSAADALSAMNALYFLSIKDVNDPSSIR
ncbi:VasL domain-containing protein [Pantoea agglomerans]|uniref:VasL domain-containing protein n=1 Tax=Enterobacter agglomerans TaxID=549 RepID=UPI00241335BE|nr:VasL domain-containing protein [Pantoea agglomerans]